MAIHGDKSQTERDMVLNQFRTGRSPIMVATDVAARGLDVKNIKTVINFDFPSCCEDYVHRIGRTGRAGAKGTAYSFFTSENARQGKDLIKILEQSNQNVPEALRTMSYNARKYYFKLYIIFFLLIFFLKKKVVLQEIIDGEVLQEEEVDLEEEEVIVGVAQAILIHHQIQGEIMEHLIQMVHLGVLIQIQMHIVHTNFLKLLFFHQTLFFFL